MSDRGIIYGRASRDPRGGGTSVSKQLERGRDFAKRENVEVIAEIRDDNRSASRGSRERMGFTAVRDLIGRGQADLLILWEVSRSSRDLEEFMGLVNACSDKGLEIVVSGTRYDPSQVNDWLPLAFQGVMAEAEARRIKQRNIDSVETNARRGTPHGRIPYGYRRIYDPKTGVLINQTPYDEHDPSQLSPGATVIADAVKAVLNGVTLRQVCRDLNARGVPTPRTPRAKTLVDNPKGGEGDLIIGKDQGSAIGTLVERQTRTVRLLHLPQRDSDSLHVALRERMADLPATLLRSITWDQGTEMARHLQDRHVAGGTDLLLRLPFPLAARLKREHERASARLLPQRNRPRCPARKHLLSR